MARYVDAEKLVFEPNEQGGANGVLIIDRRNGKNMRLVLYALKKMVEGLPTEDVAPVVHARWIAVDEYMTDECSNCGARINIEEFDDCSYHPKYGNVRLDYCPNCGAKMDLEV